MRKKYISLIVLFTSCFYLFSCGDSPTGSNAAYDFDLVERKKITLPIDENTYYMSKSIYQFEEDTEEYLYFQNTEKRQYEIIIFNLGTQQVAKRIPLSKQGPNAVPAIFGSKPLENSNTFLFFQNSASRITIFSDKGQILRKYSIRTPREEFMPFFSASYFFTPSFIKDSVLYISPDIARPNIKRTDWQRTPMFFSLDLQTGEIAWGKICYPSIFNKDVKNLAGGESFTYDYNYQCNRLVCSYTGYDSLMVTDDLETVRWYNGKSRYLKSLRPNLGESSEGLKWLKEYLERAKYSHIMYDKYRDVYYRFAEHPCEVQYAMDEPRNREFSVIIFDKDFNIIGETKFPGNKYFYKMSFIGRDGLYISENNLGNPDFDEDKLVFACFKPEKLKSSN